MFVIILVNHKEGTSYFEIPSIIQMSKSIVYRVTSKFKVGKTLEPKSITDRPPMTIKQEDRMIVKMSLKHCFDTETSISCGFC